MQTFSVSGKWERREGGREEGREGWADRLAIPEVEKEGGREGGKEGGVDLPHLEVDNLTHGCCGGAAAAAAAAAAASLFPWLGTALGVGSD